MAHVIGLLRLRNNYSDKRNYVNIPTKREMLKVAELEMERLPFLYYGTKKELTEQKIKPVVI